MKETVGAISKEVRKEIKVPGDKSITHRSIIFGSIAKGKTVVNNYLASEDCLCTKAAFEAMGVKTEEKEIENLPPSYANLSKDQRPKQLIIHGEGFSALKKPDKEIYLGNSGTSIRLLSGLFAGLPFETVLTGDEYLSQRPMKRVVEPLKKMGANIEAREDNFAPLIINKGENGNLSNFTNRELKLAGFNYDSSIASAQVKSCLMLAGLNAEGTTTVTEPELSRNHSELMLKAFGADLSVYKEGSRFCVSIKTLKEELKGQNFRVPSDISSAAFFMVAAAILPKAELTLIETGINPTRTGILKVFDKMQVRYRLGNKRVEAGEPVADIVAKDSEIKATTISKELIPSLIDEIPIIAVLAAQADGTTIIKDAEELRVKESDRIKTTVNLLLALGVNVEEKPDGMIIEGRNGKPFEPNSGYENDMAKVTDEKIIFDSHGDHRIAMSAAIAALHSTKPIEIHKTEFVKTSFPNFFEILNSLKN